MLRDMTKDKKLLYASAVALILLLIPLFFVEKSISRYITAVLLVLSAVAVSFLIKTRRILSMHSKTVALLLFVVALLSVLFYYLSGLYFGFFKNPYISSALSGIIRVITVTASIIAIEIIRRIFLSYDGKLITVLAYFAGVFVDIIISSSIISFSDFNAFIELVGLTLMPCIAANLLYNYISRRYGVLPTVVYRLPIALYIYVVPYVSGISEMIHSFLKMIIPLFALWFIDMLYEKRRKYARKRASKIGYVFTAFLSLLMVSVVMLISCQFRYGILVIGSESMTGEINKGDGVIYEKYSGGVKEGEVIVFDKEGVRLVHRVIKIERIDGENRYYTKGDANNDADRGYIKDGDIIGTVELKISYIGYPTLWMRSIFDKLS